MESGKKIIVTTIQKLPYIADGMQDLSNKRFAVIIDEAHSSQSGTLSDSLNEALGRDTVEEIDEIDEYIIKTMKSRKMSKNASFLAFTATQSIESAIRYYQSINKHLDKRGNPFKITIAFSGKKVLMGWNILKRVLIIFHHPWITQNHLIQTISLIS